MTDESSPFAKYRDTILGKYGAALVLQDIMLSCWAGSRYPASLSRLHMLDGRHMPVALKLIDHYAKHGENDADFMALSKQVAEARPDATPRDLEGR